jgi:hypothetical protein
MGMIERNKEISKSATNTKSFAPSLPKQLSQHNNHPTKSTIKCICSGDPKPISVCGWLYWSAGTDSQVGG